MGLDNLSSIAFVAAGLQSYQARGVQPPHVTLDGCLPANAQIYGDASKALESGGQNGAQISALGRESFSLAFTPKSWSVRSANLGPAVPVISYPPDVRQDIPDAFWRTETDFFAGPNQTPASYPALNTSVPPPAGPPFPAVRGLDVAGRVESGTRVFFRLTGIPTGVKVFVPVRIVIRPQEPYFSGKYGEAALISATPSSDGEGPFTTIAGNGAGLAPLTIDGGQAQAIYEILAAELWGSDNIVVPIAVSFPGGQRIAGGQVQIRGGFAPWHTMRSADATSPIPRFAPGGSGGPLGSIDITGCGLQIDQQSLTFQTAVGQDPGPQTITFHNGSNTTFSWSAAKDGAWLSVSPVSGFGPGSITVRANASTLAAGSYDGRVTVTWPGNVTQAVPVRLVVAGAPNYAGSVDTKSCDAISGWAADRSRLNQSISVSLWAGNSAVATMLASGSRLDVGTYLGDNGLHGFTFPVPSGLRDGVQRTYSVRFESGSSTVGTTFNLTCGTAPPPPTVANNTGYFDGAGCDAMKGWAADLNRLNQAISVELVEGTTVLATVLANGSRSDVGAAIGDNGLHGFTIPTPDSLKNGATRSVIVRYAGTTQTLPNSPRTIQCGSTQPPPTVPKYAGYFDSLSCDAASGWAADQNRLNQAISVELVEGTSVLATVLANASRPDVGAVLGDSGLHGFTIPIPDSLKNGLSRTVLMRFAGTTQSIANSPKTLQCGSAPPPSNPRYTGFVDNPGCQVIDGWAADLNRLNQSISVDLVEGSSVLATVLANVSRPDVGSYIGDSGLHGFSVPTPAVLKTGTARTINLRYSGTTQLLGGSPKTITCAGSGTQPPSYDGWVDQVGCSTISGWAADRNRLNTSISVDILEGSTLLGTVLANGVRGDVGTNLGDNGAHAFAWVTPTSLKDGRDHTITVRPAGSATVLGGAQILRCTVP